MINLHISTIGSSPHLYSGDLFIIPYELHFIRFYVENLIINLTSFSREFFSEVYDV